MGEEAWKPGSPGLLRGLCPPEPPLGKDREEHCRLASPGEGHALGAEPPTLAVKGRSSGCE